ncbi:MAG: adenylyl-sulfate kinase [Planctomycetes bacterium]|nr:adenylyl-sulfate kinase [Planctomycetota bacterium]
MSQRSTNVTFHDGEIGRAHREALLGQRGCVLWFTGLSGSGKSTVARALEADLYRHGKLVYVLDGDNVRHGLNGDLDFSPTGREENIRRIGEVAALFVDAGAIVLSAFISPYRSDRALARSKCPDGRFLEVFVDTPLEVCERRDPKGLYAKARAGEIAEFTGISAPYETPDSPEITIRTGEHELAECVKQIRVALEERGLLDAPEVE